MKYAHFQMIFTTDELYYNFFPFAMAFLTISCYNKCKLPGKLRKNRVLQAHYERGVLHADYSDRIAWQR